MLHGTAAHSGTPPPMPATCNVGDRAKSAPQIQSIEIGDTSGEYAVFINNAEANRAAGRPNNAIRSSKYTLWNFLPKNLFEQFRRLANFYFLIIVCLQLLPSPSPLSPITSILALLFVLTVSAVKDALEAISRFRADQEQNRRPARIQRAATGEFVETKTESVQCGSIVLVRNDEVVPADVVLLLSSSPHSECYFETANLDGEANLKKKTALHALRHLVPEDLVHISGKVRAEEPNAKLHELVGQFYAKIPSATGDEADQSIQLPLNLSDVALRGSRLQNTNWMCGLVLYAGPDTRVARNQATARPKFTHLERVINRFIVVALIIQIILSVGCSLASVQFERNKAAFMQRILLSDSLASNEISLAARFGQNLVAYVILFNSLIPMSLMVSLEIVRVFQSKFMEWDCSMFFDRRTDQDRPIKDVNENTDAPTPRTDHVARKRMLPRPARARLPHRAQGYHVRRSSFAISPQEVDSETPRRRSRLLSYFRAQQQVQEVGDTGEVASVTFPSEPTALNDTDISCARTCGCLVRASNLAFDLGAVDVILSDKTGTITENRMEFVRCSIAGEMFDAVDMAGELYNAMFTASANERRDSIREFFRAMALCHTVHAEKRSDIGDGTTTYAKRRRHSIANAVERSPNPISVCVSSSVITSSGQKRDLRSTSQFSSCAIPPNHFDGDGRDPRLGAESPRQNGRARPYAHSSILTKEALAPEFDRLSFLRPTPLTFPKGHADDSAKGRSVTPRTFVSESGDNAQGDGIHSPTGQCTLSAADQTPSQRAPPSSSRASMQASARAPGSLQNADDTNTFVNAESDAGTFETIDGQSQIQYRAQSPDEVALVTAASDFQVTLLRRSGMHVLLAEGKQAISYEILNTLEFTSERCRMSVVVRLPDGTIRLYVKGADSVVLANLAESNSPSLLRATKAHIEACAESGLRTLVYAYRDIDLPTYTAWEERFVIASSSLTNREREVARVSAEIERDLTLMGCTAVEDRLQAHAEQTIRRFLRAKIKFWMLTGDKMETAINIGYSCGLLARGRDIDRVHASTESACIRQVEHLLAEYESSGHNRSIVVSGGALRVLLTSSYRDKFFKVLSHAHAVICCRVTPKQKSDIVVLVKEFTSAHVLAIGDGANDVAMITKADVGVGVAGEEGTQAVRAADFAIGRFKDLARLILVHGRQSRLRQADLVHYFFYKNIAFTLNLFFYSLYTGFSAQTLFDSWLIQGFNMVFTALPPMLLGCVEQDLDDSMLLKFPETYGHIRQHGFFNAHTILRWAASGVLHAAACFYGSFAIFHGSGVLSKEGRSEDFVSFSLFSSLVIVLIVHIKLAFRLRQHTVLTSGLLLLSLVLFFVFVLVYSLYRGSFFYGYTHPILYSPHAILGTLAIIITVALLDMAGAYYQRQYRPHDWQVLLEDEKRSSRTRASPV